MSFTSTSIEYKTQRYLPHVKLTTKCELCALTWVESHCRQRVQSACASQLFADDVVPARCKSASAATSERQGRARRSASVTGIAVASTAVGLRGWHSLRRSDYGSCLLLPTPHSAPNSFERGPDRAPDPDPDSCWQVLAFRYSPIHVPHLAR